MSLKEVLCQIPVLLTRSGVGPSRLGTEMFITDPSQVVKMPLLCPPTRLRFLDGKLIKEKLP